MSGASILPCERAKAFNAGEFGHDGVGREGSLMLGNVGGGVGADDARRPLGRTYDANDDTDDDEVTDEDTTLSDSSVSATSKSSLSTVGDLPLSFLVFELALRTFDFEREGW